MGALLFALLSHVRHRVAQTGQGIPAKTCCHTECDSSFGESNIKKMVEPTLFELVAASGSCELRSPARLHLNEGTRRAGNRGGLFFRPFLLATQKKWASCRSATGGFDLRLT